MTRPCVDEPSAEAAQRLPLRPSSSEATLPALSKKDEQLPEAVAVEAPVILWRSLMLEQ